MLHDVRIGTAGWNIPAAHRADFAGEGTHLQRYAQHFSAVEVNSSFYRPHQPKTYQRWADSVPAGFRFSVKIPREISHVRRLIGVDLPMERFIDETAALGDRLGPFLLQLPPSLPFEDAVARTFFETMRQRFDGQVICEPRHPSWFTDDAEEVLRSFAISRAAADPARVPKAAIPGGSPDLIYRRLHGSPRIYYSSYSDAFLTDLKHRISSPDAQHCEQWCTFDNTALGDATKNALSLSAQLGRSSPWPPDPILSSTAQ